ncbi:hypothetical protein HPB52_018066 [Rhipicephalus sanguineus]|uniref:CRAL-TRIO domain-containing protein n=1 Tax=Rhipicephalus sanguineus TaxID=34632 RepID=A0A9D4Q1K4_RHISA|nr:hypothetical protein HPB52_018066 [Rhipicephalus sanguineus]
MPYMLDNDDFGDRVYWDRVTMENIKELRQRLQQWPERHELCYPDELQRVMEDDDYCRNIVGQVRLNMTSAHKFVADMLAWRRAMKLHVVLRNKNYIKGLADPDRVKQVFLFFVEKLFNECHAKKITILMDCTDIGVSNIDIDLLKFVVDVFDKKYPIGLAILRMIKSLLTFGADRLKTVNKQDIQQYIDAKYLPVRMGGMDTYEYTYVPGKPLGDRAH